MAHECPDCGQACYCDGDDTWMESEWVLAHCEHACDPENDDLEYGAEDEDSFAGDAMDDADMCAARAPGKPEGGEER